MMGMLKAILTRRQRSRRRRACEVASWDNPCEHNCWKCHDTGRLPSTTWSCDCPAKKAELARQLERLNPVEWAEERRLSGKTHDSAYTGPK